MDLYIPSVWYYGFSPWNWADGPWCYGQGRIKEYLNLMAFSPDVGKSPKYKERGGFPWRMRNKVKITGKCRGPPVL
jgi:hypothetical protein